MVVRIIDSLNGVDIREQVWEFERPKLTVRALLQARVSREVEVFNLHRPEVYRGLVQPEESERILNGYRVKVLRTLDPEHEFERAIQAFRTNGLLILAGKRQIESLDEEIDLSSVDQVEFLKLVPLIGG